MEDLSFIYNAHPKVISELYDKYKADPKSVDASWQLFFKGFDFSGTQVSSSNGNGQQNYRSTQSGDLNIDEKEFSVFAIIVAYRNRGHLRSTTNPIRQRKDRKPNLDLADFNLTEADLDKRFKCSSELGLNYATLREIIQHLEKIYAGNIGFEYMHLPSRSERRWLRDRIESMQPNNSYGLSPEKKKRILEKLNGAVVFEDFLGKKWVGQKRFSIEGAETTIAALDAIFNHASDLGVEEAVIGMAHRGRLNVLANIMGKTYEQIFNEFEGTAIPDLSFGDGDVKYHLGYSSQIETPSKKTMHLKLVPNPSHLESVDPVVQGFTRAKGDLLYGADRSKVMAVLLHGDAAAAGQGVVYETSQMSNLDGYTTGGTIHFIINNQIGFTTDFDDARSSHYSSAAANAISAPIFHVNGDDSEAVIFATELAVSFRQQFKKDVWIDMVCYRRHGHNEGDDPSFTQPEMYAIIKNHPNAKDIYAKKLLESNEFPQDLVSKMEDDFRKFLQDRLNEVKENTLSYEYQDPELAWKKLKRNVTDPEDFKQSPVTGIPGEIFNKILEGLMKLPEDFTLVSKIKRLMRGKQKLIDQGILDWGYGELMAYASLLIQGNSVRMSGQDVKRGTFSHRHAVFYDDGTQKQYNRINYLDPEQKKKFTIYNSLLSEFAVLGFEYGYALASPDQLVIWEAQFGDFSNGAQTIIDQYITAAESKWRRMNGLVMLLPHGYAGQGPEHSSARLERFLQSCAEFNITVANCTTPASFFHLIRRQLARPFRKPLVVMSPKSLLRHSKVVSKFEDFLGDTRFQEIIDDSLFNKTAAAKKVKRVLMCTGKVYFDLLDYQEKNKIKDIAIVRFEQIYPIAFEQVKALEKRYQNAKEWVWVQEEPANMGAWQFINCHMQGRNFKYIARKASASPSTGFKKIHDDQQQEIVEKSFGKM